MLKFAIFFKRFYIQKSKSVYFLNKFLLYNFLFVNLYEYMNRGKEGTKIYMKCMLRANVDPHETVVIEDSHHGRKAAINSGAHLCAVKNSSDVTYEKIKETIDKVNRKQNVRPKWQGGKMNVLIPMAGAGSRFQQAGQATCGAIYRATWRAICKARKETPWVSYARLWKRPCIRRK